MTTLFSSKRSLFASVFAASLFLAGCGALTAPMVEQQAMPTTPEQETVTHPQNAPHNFPKTETTEGKSSGDSQSAPVTHNTYPGE